MQVTFTKHIDFNYQPGAAITDLMGAEILQRAYLELQHLAKMAIGQQQVKAHSEINTNISIDHHIHTKIDGILHNYNENAKLTSSIKYIIELNEIEQDIFDKLKDLADLLHIDVVAIQIAENGAEIKTYDKILDQKEVDERGIDLVGNFRSHIVDNVFDAINTYNRKGI